MCKSHTVSPVCKHRTGLRSGHSIGSKSRNCIVVKAGHQPHAPKHTMGNCAQPRLDATPPPMGCAEAE